jgi:hypothetical protein
MPVRRLLSRDQIGKRKKSAEISRRVAAQVSIRSYATLPELDVE